MESCGRNERWEKVDFYAYNEKNEEYMVTNTVSNHYITILGIEDSWDDPLRIVLRLSSRRKGFFIYYDEYVSYASE